jgi:hypothetical protein
MTTEMAEVRSVNRWQVYKIVLSACAVCAVTALALWFHFADPSTTKYTPVLQQLADNQLHANTLGHVDLSGPFPGLTPHDEMFLTRRTDGSFLAFFPTFYGQGTAVGGLVYTSRLFQPGDTYMRRTLTNIDRPVVDVADWPHLMIDKRLDDHWYTVSRGLRQ